MERERFVRVHFSPTHKPRDMKKEGGTVGVDLGQGPSDVPGHTLEIILKQEGKVFADVTDLGAGFVPERLKRRLRLLRVLPVATPVRAGLGFERFDIHTRNKVGEEQD